MSMSKKDYVAIANIMAFQKDAANEMRESDFKKGYLNALNDVTKALADALAANPNFNPHAFAFTLTCNKSTK